MRVALLIPLGCLAMLVTGGEDLPSTLPVADDLFQKQEYQAALEKYDAVSKEAGDPEVQEKAFFRSCQSLVLLQRSGEALDRLRSREAPADARHRARFLMLKAEVLKRFVDQYRSVLRSDVIEENSADVFRITPEQLRTERAEAYAALWDLRHDLAAMDVRDESYFLDTSSADVARYPTLLDYLVSVWTRALVGGEVTHRAGTTAAADAGLLLVDSFDWDVSFEDPTGLFVAEILEGTADLRPDVRRRAVECSRIERLLLPLDQGRLFDLRRFAGAPDGYEADDAERYRWGAEQILLGWFEGLGDAEARARAGYEAAVIIHGRADYVAALALCGRIIEELPGTEGAALAGNMAASIQAPAMGLAARTVTPPGKGAFTLATRNVERVLFRAYRMAPRQVREAYCSVVGNHPRQIDGWSMILDGRWLDSMMGRAWLVDRINSETEAAAWSVETGDRGDYGERTNQVSAEGLDLGLYLVVASGERGFQAGNQQLAACFLNVTNVVVIATAGPTVATLDRYYRELGEPGRPDGFRDEALHFYALDAASGKPAATTRLIVSLYDYARRGEASPAKPVDVDAEGQAGFDAGIGISPGARTRFSVDALALCGDGCAYLSHELSFSYTVPAPLTLFVETDRPIYKPGERVKVKVVGVRRTADGFECLDEEAEITLVASDPNRKDFFWQTARLGEFGSADLSFEIPCGRLLGKYSIGVTCTSGSLGGGGGKTFRVEEYKQPEFEISLKPAATPWKYGQMAEAEGQANYYFGGPVPGAVITYRLLRKTFVPFGWIRLADPYGGRAEELARGEVTTDATGNFRIGFTPWGPGGHETGAVDISDFTVEVEGRDSGGRTITARRSYRAGGAAIFTLIKPVKGFFVADDPIEIRSTRLTMNDTAAPGSGEYKVFLLAEAPQVKTDHADLAGQRLESYGRTPSSLDAQLASVPSGRLVAEGTVVHDGEGKALIEVGHLPGGTYRLVETTLDEWGVTVSGSGVFVVAGKPDGEVLVPAPEVTLVEKDEYQVGDKARFVIGSCRGSGFYHVEVWVGEYLVERRTIEDTAPVRLVELEITERLKGGFALRWFGVKDLEVLSGQATVSVPRKEKRLDVALAPFAEELLPGREYTWGVELKDHLGRPVRGEVLAVMYDRSLEYYVGSGQAWLERLYDLPTAYLRIVPSAFRIGVTFPYADRSYASAPWLPTGPDDARSAPTIPLAPSAHWEATRSLRTANTVDEAIAARAGVVLEQGQLHVRGGRAGETAFFVDGLQITDPFVGGEASPEARARAVEPRSEFRDVAFFEPHIVTSDGTGRGTFTFTAPEQMTSWRVKALAYTKDVAQGSLVLDAVTKKRLIVRADLPRFFREKDRGTVTALVHNESEGRVAGEVFIDITENQVGINEKLGIRDNRQSFSLGPHGVASFDWTVAIPDGVGEYRARVSAVTDSLSDAEERELPIFPSRQRLIESAFALLSGNETEQLRIALKPDATMVNESMVLQIEPQLALTVLSTVPFLVECPYGCVEQILNKYVPLSIINEVYRQYPAIQRAVSRIPKRTTITPPWEVEDPRRLTALMETPWVWESEGRPASCTLTDLLDPEVVRSQAEISLSRLESAQLPSGAFPWWPGGDPDLYITLYVLDVLAEAHRYGADLPEPIAGRALDYAVPEIARRLDTEPGNLALVALAAYVFTCYPSGRSHQINEGRRLAAEWVGFLDSHVALMGDFSKARLALTHFNLGNVDRARAVLDLLMDGAREDPIAGVYWTPEKCSWVWYSDTVERHAFILRALQAIRPEDLRIPGMVRWLLFNRKGTAWKSTKASAAAVYAVLDFLRLRGALENDEIITVDWANRSYSAVVKPDDWLSQPLRWHETGFDITQEMSTAAIEKQGPGLAFAGLTWTYSTDQMPEASEPGMLSLERRFYKRVWEAGAYHLVPIKSGSAVAVGDQIEVQLEIDARAQFEYMHLKDPKAAGFESETLLSGWKRDALSFYEEPRNSLTNFFLGRMPHGEYVLRYRLRPTKPGTYRIGAAILQSMYAPEMTAHSSGFVIDVVKP